jgi:hypothetical protein
MYGCYHQMRLCRNCVADSPGTPRWRAWRRVARQTRAPPQAAATGSRWQSTSHRPRVDFRYFVSPCSWPPYNQEQSMLRRVKLGRLDQGRRIKGLGSGPDMINIVIARSWSTQGLLTITWLMGVVIEDKTALLDIGRSDFYPWSLHLLDIHTRHKYACSLIYRDSIVIDKKTIDLDRITR